jgi:predicted site-specific integrase-resolvase
MPSTDLLATVQVCERIGIDRSTLSRYVQLGRITPAHQLPGTRGAMLFDPADVDKLDAWYHGERLTGKAS